MIVLGIDPGLHGAIAIVRDGTWEIVDMPILGIERNGKAKNEVDIGALAAILGHPDWNEDVAAFVEQVGAMPKQGVSSVFAFGKGYGIILGILGALKVPATLVPPTRWKKALGVPPGKDAARYRASQVLPDLAGHWKLKKHDGRAEAAMIAEYGRRTLA